MSDPFVHLRVASSFSLKYGVSPPERLIAQALEHGQSALALTDRDGLYGSVTFIQAASRAGLTPILGVDLALETPDGPKRGSTRRTPARGGTFRPETARVVLFGRNTPAGWAALCHVVSAAYAYGERDAPRLSAELLGEHLHTGDLIMMLGADSPVGQAVAAHRQDAAIAYLHGWAQQVGAENLRVEIACHLHQDPGLAHIPGTPAVRSVGHAVRMLQVADQAGVTPVASNAVRYTEPHEAKIADVLDSVRRLVPLHSRRREMSTTQASLKSWEQMRAVLTQVCDGAGTSVAELLGQTRRLAEECTRTPADVGLGSIYLPELSLLRGGQQTASAPTDERRLADRILRERCEAALHSRGNSKREQRRLHAELATIAEVGFASYFLTVADIVTGIREQGMRVAARGSGAGSFVNYLLGVSGVNPLEHNLLMERFLSPLRRALPDIDLDVESARRTEVYDMIFSRFGSERVACVSMRDTYRARHAIRDVGAALGMSPGDIDAFAKAIPHVRASGVRDAIENLPEVQQSHLGRRARSGELDTFLDLVAGLDGLPRHVAMHPCGIVLSDAHLRDRTPIETSVQGYPMTQFDKDEVEDVGLLKLDVLGIRMQSAMQHAVAEIARTADTQVDLDAVPLTDPQTFELIRSTHTLGCFQIESPGQRELIGKLAPETFADLIIDISLFRPGPVKGDMIRPFLAAREGQRLPDYFHEDLREVLRETHGVVVFHEQVLRIVSVMTGCSLAAADEVRRNLGDRAQHTDIRGWFYRAAQQRRYSLDVIDTVWEVISSFASFGFCKAHAAAFALPTYQSAWLKTHFPAAFFAGLLTHDPGMYPKRLILEDARRQGVEILPLDINASGRDYRVENCGSRGGIRLALSSVKGISAEDVDRICHGQPYSDLSDFWYRAGVGRMITEALAAVGAFDQIAGMAIAGAGRQSRRDLLVTIADFDYRDRALRGRSAPGAKQMSFDFDSSTPTAGHFREFTAAERVETELDILGMDVSAHLVTFYRHLLEHLGVTWSHDLLAQRSDRDILVGGVKVATQTPPIRSGTRVVFLTLDDSTGPVDITFFPGTDNIAQVFHSWLLLVRGRVRRTGQRGVSIRATDCWDLTELDRIWRAEGIEAVRRLLASSAPETQPQWARRRKVVEIQPTVAPAGTSPSTSAPSKLWHSSPGSSGW